MKYETPFLESDTNLLAMSLWMTPIWFNPLLGSMISKKNTQDMQKSLDTWEASLKATCGAIVPDKTFWYLLDFKWQAGEWKYYSKAD